MKASTSLFLKQCEKLEKAQRDLQDLAFDRQEGKVVSAAKQRAAQKRLEAARAAIAWRFK